jgi:Flp pilus assembly protein TadD
MTDKKSYSKWIRINMSVVIRLICTVFFLTILLSAQGLALTPAQVFDKVKDTVVVVKTLDTQSKVKSQGSGVLISSDRVVTNCHVVEGGASYRAGRGNQLVSATLYAEDADKDICILTATGIAGTPAQFGKAAGLKVGNPVYAVGAPRGLELSLSDGIVAQLRGGPPPLIQTTAAISPGSSGGGLFDREGRLVGLTTLYVEGGQNLNFAMPVEWIGEIKPGRQPAAKGIGRTEWEKRSIAFEDIKNWRGMLDWCQKWVKSNPKNPSAWNSLGIAYGHLNRYQDAIEPYRQALRIDPKMAGVWFGLGTAYGNLSRHNDAIEAYRQSLAIDPGSANAWYNLGITYSKLELHNDAIEAYRQSLAIDPVNADAWTGLTIAYVLSGNRAAALDTVAMLQLLDPEKADKLFNMIVPR